MRGELWIARAELYASKVRPVLIVQSDEYDAYDSVITCLLTSYDSENDTARVRIEPDALNNLKSTSYVMVDKIFSFDKADLDRCMGRLSEEDLGRVSKKLRSVLEL